VKKLDKVIKEEELEKEARDIAPAVASWGGKLTLKRKIITGLFFGTIVTCFTIGIFTTGVFAKSSLEIGLLLLSIKIGYFIYNEARINHYEFWILRSIESRLNTLLEEVRENRDALRESMRTAKYQGDPEKAKDVSSS